MTADHHLWIADGVNNKFLKYDLNGKLLYSWGSARNFPGCVLGRCFQFLGGCRREFLRGGNFCERAQKFVPKAGADPALLVGEAGAADGESGGLIDQAKALM